MRQRDRESLSARTELFAGTLIGTAVGDALGLPAENLNPARIQRLYNGEWRMRFVLRRGMVSDDTEHTLLLAQALLSEANDPARFQKVFASKLRWWFAAAPAGIGLATARACIKLWSGFGPEKAAVASGGSGPAMRSAIIGIYFANDAERRRAFVLASARLTHRGWQAETAARVVAECAAYAASNSAPPGTTFIEELRNLSGEAEWHNCIAELESSIAERRPVRDFAHRLGLEAGVTGYSLHVTSVAIYSWILHWRDYRAAVVSALECGGDTDTVGAIVGAMAGATATVEGIPSDWRLSLVEWPRSPEVMLSIAHRLAEQQASGIIRGPVSYCWPAIPLRNLFFLLIVLLHGIRRLLPPY